jgi:hypothetical protein
MLGWSRRGVIESWYLMRGQGSIYPVALDMYVPKVGDQTSWHLSLSILFCGARNVELSG